MTQPAANAATKPAARPAADAARPAAPPPSPKVQALSTALELAKIRAAAGLPSDRVTTVDMLISDAEAIAAFIGTGPPRNAVASLGR